MEFKKVFLVSLIFLICLCGLSSISAHGVDVTDDTMIIANESNCILAKEIVDEMNVNVTVYEFTSSGEAEHIMEHMLNNSNKRVIVLSYQDTAHDFLNKHGDLSNRLIIVDDVNNQTIHSSINQLLSVKTQPETVNYILPLIGGLIIGLIIGLGLGVLIMKRKYEI